MKKYTLITLTQMFFLLSAYSQTSFCMGEKKTLKIGSLMPYTKIKIGNAEGYFLIDFGTTASSIDTNGFINEKTIPADNGNSFDNFDFFGSWGKVRLNIQDQSHIQGLGDFKQAGIIGTDFLCFNIFTLDYVSKSLLRADSNKFCNDATLISQGFKATSTAGYFSNDLSKLNNTCSSNIPTIPVKIGNITAAAQIDPGYDDKSFKFSVNINQAFFNAIKESGIELIQNQQADSKLSTCISGLMEDVKAYKLPEGKSFSIIGIDGNAIIVKSDINIFLKKTPIEAKSCGGIGTWQIPAAQLGASFLIDSKKVIFDPFKQRVWFYTK